MALEGPKEKICKRRLHRAFSVGCELDSGQAPPCVREAGGRVGIENRWYGRNSKCDDAKRFFAAFGYGKKVKRLLRCFAGEQQNGFEMS